MILDSSRVGAPLVNQKKKGGGKKMHKVKREKEKEEGK